MIMHYTEQKPISQQMELKSRKELARICYLLDKYAKEFKMEFDLATDYLMAESGYLKAHYIPNETEELKLIGELTYKYIKSYNVRYTQFIVDLRNCYDYCKINGYPKDVNQTLLVTSFGANEKQVGGAP